MDILLAPFTIHVNCVDLSDLLLARIVMLLFTVYTEAAWIFPHIMSFMIATIFTHQFKALNRSFEKMLTESDERRLSDSDVGRTETETKLMMMMMMMMICECQRYG